MSYLGITLLGIALSGRLLALVAVAVVVVVVAAWYTTNRSRR